MCSIARRILTTWSLLAITLCALQPIPAHGGIEFSFSAPTTPASFLEDDPNCNPLDVTDRRDVGVRIEPISNYYPNEWTLGDPSLAFSPFTPDAEQLLEPPVQREITLHSGEPLAIFQPLVHGDGVTAKYELRREGNEFFLNAIVEHHIDLVVTGVWYSPGYLLTPIGDLEPGDYRLNIESMNTTFYDYPAESLPTTISSLDSYLRFTVLPRENAVVVPEPSTLTLMAFAGACFLLLARPRRGCRA